MPSASLTDVAATLPVSEPLDIQEAKLGKLQVTSTISTGIPASLSLQRRRDLLDVFPPETGNYRLFPRTPGATRFYIRCIALNSGESSITLSTQYNMPTLLNSSGQELGSRIVGVSQLETHTTPYDYNRPNPPSFELGPGGTLDWILGCDISRNQSALVVSWALGPIGPARFVHNLPQ